MDTKLKRRSGAGRYRRSGKRSIGTGTLFALAAVLIALLAFGTLRLIRSRRPPPDPNAPIMAAQHFVQVRGGSDKVYLFSPLELTKMETSEGGVTVSGYVEVVPKSGRSSASYNYKCVLNHENAGSWSLMKLDMMLQ